MTIDEARKTIEEAHAACPCRIKRSRELCSNPFCRCEGNLPHLEPTDKKCRWPGHTAIDRALRSVLEVAAEVTTDHIRENRSHAFQPDTFLSLPAAIRSLARDLLGEEKPEGRPGANSYGSEPDV